MQHKFVDKLKPLVEPRGQTIPFWLEELLVNGPRYEAWTPPNYRPNRVMLTEFLARWLMAVGVPHDEALQWLLEYCSEVLGPFSKSGPSAIRHGTKANTRYVYRSSYLFDFDALAKDLQTQGNQPPYMPVLEKWRALLPESRTHELETYRRLRREMPRDPATMPVKERYREQFGRAVEFARQKTAENLTAMEIAALLNEAGYLTITGRKWSKSTVDRLLLSLK